MDNREILLFGLIGFGLFLFTQRASANVTQRYIYKPTNRPVQTSGNDWPEITFTPFTVPTMTQTKKPINNISPNKPEFIVSEPVQSTRWQPPATAKPYLSWLHDAELQYNLPHNLLTRVAYQESRFRDDIITGKTVSSAGAQGIMQIIPRWHPGVNPLNPKEAIYYAASYLRKLYNRFNDWNLALAAYNWGQGNVATKGIHRAPTETQVYVAHITRDLGLS